MDDSTRRMLEGLRSAMRAEFEGHSFYLMAARATEDVRGREVFQALAEEELEHAGFLKVQHAALEKTGRVDPAASLGRPRDLAGASPIFSAALRQRIGEAHFEMTSLSVGIQLEQNAMRFYGEQARAAGDPEIRLFYESLARWETGHYEALLRQQEALRDDYWQKNEFSPF